MGKLRQKLGYIVKYEKKNIGGSVVRSTESMVVITDTIDEAHDAVLQYWGKKTWKINITDVSPENILIYKDDIDVVVSELKLKRERLKKEELDRKQNRELMTLVDSSVF